MEFVEGYQQDLIRRMSDPKFMAHSGYLLNVGMFDVQFVPVVESVIKAWTKKKVLSRNQIKQLSIRYQVKLSGRAEGDYSFDHNEIIEFIKYQTIRDALLKAGIFRDTGQYDKAIEAVLEARKRFPSLVGTAAPDILMSNRPFPGRKNLIATGLDTLDRHLNGGIASGDLAVVMAPTSGGKTSFLTWLATQAVHQGKKVYYITLEVPGYELEGKLRRCLSGEEKPNKAKWEKLGRKLRRAGGRMNVREYSPHSVSAIELDAEMPSDTDLLIIDYADYLRTPSGKIGLEYHDLGAIYTSLKAVGLERKIPVWTASQVNRQAYAAKTLSAEDVESSLKKVMVADQIIGIGMCGKEDTQNEELKCAQLILRIVKNRHGMRLQDIHVISFWATCKFQEGWTID